MSEQQQLIHRCASLSLQRPINSCTNVSTSTPVLVACDVGDGSDGDDGDGEWE